MKWKDIDNKYICRIDKLRNLSPYERLGLDSSATLEEAKRAYSRMIRLYHPDKTDDFMSEYGGEVVKLLNQAIDRIKSEKKPNKSISQGSL